MLLRYLLFIKNNVISEDQELADTFNDFFEHAVDNLGIKEYVSDENINTNLTSNDPIDNAILKYKNHPSMYASLPKCII